MTTLINTPGVIKIATVIRGAEIELFTTEASLLASTRPDGTLAYAQDVGHHHLRQLGAWVQINTSTVATGGGGWIYVEDFDAGLGGAVWDRVFQDAGATVLKSARVSSTTIEVTVRSSFPLVWVNGSAGTLTRDVGGGFYRGSVSITLPLTGEVEATAVTPEGTLGAFATAVATPDLPPQLLTLQFTGGYPGTQTELKAGDTFQLSGTLDKPADGIDVATFGACDAQVHTFASSTAFTITVTIADRGVTPQALAARMRPFNAVGAYGSFRDTNQGGGTTDGVHVVTLCDARPSVVVGVITYPVGQGALKGIEEAYVANAVADADAVVYDDPTGSQLGVANPGTYEPSKLVTRFGGNYNVSTPNFRITAHRFANGSSTSATGVVRIANTAATLTVSLPATRLRSGGSDGTSPQDHVVTMTANQELGAPPALEPASGGSKGAWVDPAFVGGPAVWTRTFRVLDSDDRGVHAWEGVYALNLAGVPTTVLLSGSTYEIGGFVARTVVWQAWQTVSDLLHVDVVDESKLRTGVFSATYQPAIYWPAGTLPPKANGYSVNDAGAVQHVVNWLDLDAASSNSAEAYLFDYEEIV